MEEVIVYDEVPDDEHPEMIRKVATVVNKAEYDLAYIYDNLPLVRYKVKEIVNQRALALGFDDKVMASLYASTVNEYQLPACQYVKYMAAVWSYLDKTLNGMIGGTVEITSIDDVISSLPEYDNFYQEAHDELSRLYPDYYS